MTNKNQFKSMLCNLYDINYFSVNDYSKDKQKEILEGFLSELPPHRLYEIFVDADRENKLPEYFRAWLQGNVTSEFVCNYIKECAMQLYEDEMDEILESIRNEFQDDKENKKSENLMDFKYGT